MTQYRSSSVKRPNPGARQHPCPGCVGNPARDETHRQEWLTEQHQRDLQTLDRIERQLEEHAGGSR